VYCTNILVDAADLFYTATLGKTAYEQLNWSKYILEKFPNIRSLLYIVQLMFNPWKAICKICNTESQTVLTIKCWLACAHYICCILYICMTKSLFKMLSNEHSNGHIGTYIGATTYKFGWPDWANFWQFGLLWTVFWKWQQ
jgi:hypothetical protein